MDLRTDEELIHEVQEGSLVAFELLVKRYEERLISFVYRMLRNEFDAQEAVQDTFFKIYKTIDRIDTSKKFSSYIYEIAKNTSISRLRQNHQNVQLDDNIELETDEKIYEGLLKKEQAQVIRKAIRGLPAKYRNAVYSYYFEDLSYEEISKKMNLPINTVRTHMARAKEALRKVLRYEKD